MPAGEGSLGRDLVLKWNGARIAGAREKAIKINGEAVDVTDDEASGWRELLEEDGTKMVDVTLSGITKSAVLRAAKMAGGAATIGAVTLEYEDGGIIAGDFKLQGYSETGPYSNAQTFEATLQSTGAVTYTAGP